MALSEPRGAEGPSRHVVVAILVLSLLPVLTQQYVPLVDYPNHVARSFIFAHFGNVASFQATYERSFVPIPNMASDVVLGGLIVMMGMDAGSRVFLALIILLNGLSLLALSRALWGRITWITLPAILLVYSSALLYGFVNYVMSVALAQLTLAGWLVFRRRWTAAGVVVCILGAVVTYLAHLAGYAILGVAAGAIGLEELRRDRRVRRFVGDLLPLCLPLPMWLAFRAQGGHLGTTRWASWSEKAIGLLSLVRSYHVMLDMATIAVVVGAVVYLLRRRREIEWSRAALVAAGALLLAFAVSPIEAFTGSAVDQRFVPPAAILGLLAFSVDRATPRARVLYGICLVAALVRFTDIWVQWRRADPQVRAMVHAGDQLPLGARVYPIYVHPNGRDAEKQDRGFMHVLLYSLPRRELFVPTLFAIRGQQPLVFQPSTTCPKCGVQMAPTIEDIDRLAAVAPTELRGYTHVWTHGSGNATLDALTASCCERLAEAGQTTLWRLRPEFFGSH